MHAKTQSTATGRDSAIDLIHMDYAHIMCAGGSTRMDVCVLNSSQFLLNSLRISTQLNSNPFYLFSILFYFIKFDIFLMISINIICCRDTRAELFFDAWLFAHFSSCQCGNKTIKLPLNVSIYQIDGVQFSYSKVNNGKYHNFNFSKWTLATLCTTKQTRKQKAKLIKIELKVLASLNI